MAGEVKMNEVMKELAADTDLKPRMKDVASLVPRVIKALMKLSADRKANVLKIGEMNEKRNRGECSWLLEGTVKRGSFSLQRR